MVSRILSIAVEMSKSQPTRSQRLETVLLITSNQRLAENSASSFRAAPAGIKVDEKCLALGLSFDQIWNEVRNIISDRKYAAKVDDMNDRCRGRLQDARKQLEEAKPSKKNPDPAAQIALIDEILTEDAYLLPPDDAAVKIGS